MEAIIAYKPCCCNKAMLRASSAKRHENQCLKNPANKACLTCKYLEKDYETIYNPYHGGNPGSTDYEELILYCSYDVDSLIDIKTTKDWAPNYKRDCPNWALKEG